MSSSTFAAQADAPLKATKPVLRPRYNDTIIPTTDVTNSTKPTSP